MAAKRLRYDGPFQAVEVDLPDGSSVRVENGGSAEFPPEVADDLLKQTESGTPNWVEGKASPGKGEKED